MKTANVSLLRIFTPLALASALLLPVAYAADWPQWRGPNRNGVSQETGLLQEWPKEGPKLLWQARDVGRGYTAPSVRGDRIYLLGNDGLDNEFVQALAVKDGQRSWRTRLGAVGHPAQKPNFPAARSTPTVESDFLYALGSDGDLASIAIGTGKIRWQKNLRTDFGGKHGEWAYSESPLVDGEALVVTPGGDQATLLALHRSSGDVIWKCALPEKDMAAYASPIVVEVNGVRQYVQLLENGLVGVEAKTGKLLWRYKRPKSIYGANIPTPVAHDGYIYCASAGTGGGAIRLKPIEGGFTPEEVYFGAKFPTAIGGTVVVNDYLYGTTGQALVCLEFKTGTLKWEERALAPAALLFADRRLYMHGENGEVALVEISPDGYKEKGRFAPPNRPKPGQDMEKSWAYPVLADGRLFLRDHETLWAYEVRKNP